MANYQINYGFTPDGVAEPTKPSEDEPKVAKEINPGPEKKKKKTEAEEAAWFEEEEARSTKVYVSNLPSNISEESFVELMSKCGMVEYDVRNKKPKVKVYRDEEGKPKGDGLCSYIKPESVQLALTIIDGSEYEGMTLAVTRAKFEMKVLLVLIMISMIFMILAFILVSMIMLLMLSTYHDHHPPHAPPAARVSTTPS